MKKKVIISVFMMSFAAFIMAGQGTGNQVAAGNHEKINVSADPALTVLVEKWAADYKTREGSADITVLGPGDPQNDADIRFITGSALQSSGNASHTAVVGREVVVPVTGSGNPYLSELGGRGISSEDYAALLTGDKNISWGTICGNASGSPVRLIVPDDDQSIRIICSFAGIEPGTISPARVSDSRTVLEQVKLDQQAIGFCRLSDITDETGRSFTEGFSIIPVDVNNNNVSDYFEQFYSDFRSFNRGVYLGKYPHSLSVDIYAVLNRAPAGAGEASFIDYVLTGGQGIIAGSGFTALADGEGKSRLEAFNAVPASPEPVIAESSPSRAMLAWIAIIFIAGALAFLLVRATRIRKAGVAVSESVHGEHFSRESIVVPGGIMFDKGHTWAFMEKNGEVRVGVDDFLQHVTGPLTRVRMKSPGDRVIKGEALFSLVQKGKQLAIASPVTGTVVACNDRLATSSSPVNRAPYTDGWVCSLQPDNWMKESQMMLMAGKYSEWIRGEFTRLKDFVATVPGMSEKEFSHIVLQDGGELREGLLSDFGPEVWEEFQTGFLGRSL